MERRHWRCTSERLLLLCVDAPAVDWAAQRRAVVVHHSTGNAKIPPLWTMRSDVLLYVWTQATDGANTSSEMSISICSVWKQLLLCYCSLPAAFPGKLNYCAIKTRGTLGLLQCGVCLICVFSLLLVTTLSFIKVSTAVSKGHLLSATQIWIPFFLMSTFMSRSY